MAQATLRFCSSLLRGASGMSAQESLQNLWLDASDARLCPREQARAWALREAWKEMGWKPYGMFSWIAQRVRKGRGGKAKGPQGHPAVASIAEFFQKVDGDPDWFPGKHSDTPRGPKRVLSGAKKSAVAAAAKRLKRNGEEPTYSAVVAACPRAVTISSWRASARGHLWWWRRTLTTRRAQSATRSS